MDLIKTIRIAAAGMRAQGLRLKVIAENLANADSLATTPGADPYRRKLVTFQNVLDRNLNVNVVKVGPVQYDTSEFKMRHDAGHPAADKDGFVRMPNVNALIEMMDMRQAQRSYEANLSVIDVTKRMLTRTIDLLRD